MKRQRLNRHMLFPMLTVIMLLSASHICAQRNFSLFGKDVSVGVRAGITYSEISKSNYSDGKIGWLIGADLEIPVEKVSENFFIQPSLLFLSKVHIPADTRSAFPVISVQSPVSIQCCWQS